MSILIQASYFLAAVLFILAADFLLCALVTFAIDVKMAITAHDRH